MHMWWQLWEGLFSVATCEEIVKMAGDLPAIDSVVGFDSGSKVNHGIRRSKVRWVNREERWITLWDRLTELTHMANDNAYKFDIDRFQPMQFTEYDAANEGHYDWHVDIDWTSLKGMARKLSCVVQLTDENDYEGGDFQLGSEVSQLPDPAKVRKQGTVLIFPSFVNHRVIPVTKGVRHSMVAWFQGPKFK